MDSTYDNFSIVKCVKSMINRLAQTNEGIEYFMEDKYREFVVSNKVGMEKQANRASNYTIENALIDTKDLQSKITVKNIRDLCIQNNEICKNPYLNMWQEIHRHIKYKT